jgi:hypothetical protein
VKKRFFDDGHIKEGREKNSILQEGSWQVFLNPYKKVEEELFTRTRVWL